MKTFQFRPDRVLDVRRRHCDAAKVDLGRAEQALREAESDCAQADARVAMANEVAATALRSETDASVFERHRNWIARLRADGERCRAVVAERGRTVAEAGERLRAAHQAVRVLERLKDRAWRRHEVIVRQQEMKDLDEIASSRFLRRSLEGRETV